MPKKKPSRRHPIKLKYERPDVSDWTLGPIDALVEHIRASANEAASEAIRHALEDEDTGVSWGAEWTNAEGFGDGATADDPKTKFVAPLAMRLTVAVGSNPDKHPIYEFDLRESLLLALEMCRADGSFSLGLRRIMVALRSLSDEIADALPENDNE